MEEKRGVSRDGDGDEAGDKGGFMERRHHWRRMDECTTPLDVALHLHEPQVLKTTGGRGRQVTSTVGDGVTTLCSKQPLPRTHTEEGVAMPV